jgi:hypothetical protein
MANLQTDRPDSPGYDHTAAMLLDPTAPVPNPATDLLPGEARLDTVFNPYYGEVEAGTPPLPYLAALPIPAIDDIQAAVDDARVVLDGEMQTRIEVLTGKRFQQKTGEPRPKEELDRIKKGREERDRKAKEQEKERKAKADADRAERKARGEDTSEEEAREAAREKDAHEREQPTAKAVRK